MSAGFLVAALLGAGVAVWVLLPLFRGDAAETERAAQQVSERAELLSRKEQLLAALRDLEDDRDTGKMNDRDYRELEASLTAQAAEVMQRLDRMSQDERAEVVRTHPSAVPRS